MDFGDLVETRVDNAVEEAGEAGVNLKDSIHAAIKAFFEDLIALIRKLLGIEAA